MARLTGMKVLRSTREHAEPQVEAEVAQVEESQEEGITEQLMQETVLHYSEFKKQEKVVKDALSKDKEVIVDYLHKNELTAFAHSGVSVSLSYSEKVTFNMDALVPHIKKLMKGKDKEEVKGLIKKTEYVDESVLEDLIYRGILDENEVKTLADFQVTNTTEKLNVKHAKA